MLSQNRTLKYQPAQADFLSGTLPAYGAFLRGLLLNPKAVSAPTPSSLALARAIAEQVDLSRPGLVVELGPGTGVVTEALLARGLKPSRLFAVEQVEDFAALVGARFPGITVLCGDGFAFEKYLPREQPVAAVISGIPLMNFPLSARVDLLDKAMALQGESATFVQLSYNAAPPVPPPPGITVARKMVWRNFPPAHVWRYTRA